MTTLQIYINNQLVDLSDDSPMALTFQINNLAEVKNQQGNTSNQFKLPLTQRNRRILGFPDEVAFTDNSPYQQYPAKIIQDGLEIIPYGIAELNGIDQDTAAITILSGNVDFFDAIDGKIYDMGDSTTIYGVNNPFSTYDHTWNVANVASSQTKTEGWIWPVIDYGNLIFNTAGQCEVNVHYLRPGFFIKTAIDLMLAASGYKGTGSLLANPLYPKLIAQFSNSSFEHGTDYQNQPNPHGLNANIGANLEVHHVTIDSNGGDIYFPSVSSDPSQQFTDHKIFISSQINSVDITLTIPRIVFNGKVAGSHPSLLKIYIYINNDIASEATFDFSGDFTREGNTSGGGLRGTTDTKNTVISLSADLQTGDWVHVRYEFLGDRPAYFIIFAGASLVITPTGKGILYGQEVQCERIFPDISQKDLLKDILQRFGIICQTDNTKRTVNFASFRDIVNNIPVAHDWTKKCLNQGKSISFQLGGYAQINYMKHKQDDNVLPAGFADAQINVNDKTLPATADLFESQFAPTLNTPYIGGTIAQIKMTDLTDDQHEFNIGVSPRILVNSTIDLRKFGPDKSVKFTDGNASHDVTVNTFISVPYFYKPDGEFNLCFDDMPSTGSIPLSGLKSLYYPELQKILTQSKKVVRYFLLSPRDILELDLLIPVYLQQDGAYYYINKIDSWRKGQPTKVELIRL